MQITERPLLEGEQIMEKTIKTMRIDNVIYAAAERRFKGQVRIGGLAKSPYHVSAPGHPNWGYRRITAALAGKAHSTFKASQANHAHP